MKESRYLLWVYNDSKRDKKGRGGRNNMQGGGVLMQNEKRRAKEKCERLFEGTSLTSKESERGTDLVPPPPAPPLWVNNHHKPGFCLMNPPPMS